MAFNLAPPKRTLTLTKFGGLYQNADARSLPEGASPLNWDVDFDIAGIRCRPGLSPAITTFSTGTPGLFEWLKTMLLPGNLTETLGQDSGGSLWTENLTAPGTMTSIYSGILNQARATSATVNNREYIPLSDLTVGSDQPRQWDGQFLDRISQVGPGAGPAPPTVVNPSFPITNITEIYPTHNINTIIWGALLNDQTAPPPSTSLYFMGVAGDNHWLDGLNVGDFVFVTGAGDSSDPTGTLDGQNPNGTFQVVSTGDFTDVNGVHQYFGVIAATPNGDFARNTATGTYQKTQALVQLSTPIPQQSAVVGQNITISGSSVQGWNQVFPIVATPTEGQLSIGATSLTANVATYDYSLVSGNAPGWQQGFQYFQASQIVSPAGDVWQITTPGTSGGSIPAFVTSPQTDNTAVWTKLTGVQITVIVFNTTNGNGIFNVQNAVITSATSTTFTIALVHPNVSAAAEQGLAVSGSGIALIIDPGALTVGTGSPGVDPIYGNATGGFVLPTIPNVAAGQRYCVCMFLTRDNYITPASPPVSFFTTISSQQITFPNLPIGPPNVIARIVAFTAANSGIGGPYFWISEDVVLTASVATLGQTKTINKTIIYDNVSTSLGPITINDTVLIDSENISEPGNNLQQQRELGECVKVVQFGARAFYMGERTKTDTFVNMTFDGGSDSSKPAGWTITPSILPYVGLTSSQIFGQSLYIRNSSGGVINPAPVPLSGIASLSQTAYQTAVQSPVLAANTAYSVRVTTRIPSGNTGGTLVIEFYSPSANLAWQFLVPFTSMTTAMQEFTGVFGNPLWQPVPTDLLLRVYPLQMANGADIEVDRIEPFPTKQPAYSLQTIGSYLENSEAVDLLTGPVSVAQYTSDSITNHFALKFTRRYYLTTATTTYSPVDGDNEPSQWKVEPVALVGSCGPMAEDAGESYLMVADERGAWVFDGGLHIKFSQEIQPLWDSLYKPALRTVWLKNDIARQRVLIGVPLPTPNQWLPDAAINLTPTTPNVILMCSYLGCRTGREIGDNAAVHASAFTGRLLWKDGGRKWSIWQVQSGIGSFIQRPSGNEQFWFGQQAAINYLDPTVVTDNGDAILETYFMGPLPDSTTAEQLQLGSVRNVYAYATLLIEGSGSFDLTTYPETLDTPYTTTQPAFDLTSPALSDTNVPLNETGNRLFIRISTDGLAGSAFSLERLALAIAQDTRIPVSGR